eukprot:Nk52_evm49s1073 gene=Nk52_evmTU49s1073
MHKDMKKVHETFYRHSRKRKLSSSSEHKLSRKIEHAPPRKRSKENCISKPITANIPSCSDPIDTCSRPANDTVCDIKQSQSFSMSSVQWTPDLCEALSLAIAVVPKSCNNYNWKLIAMHFQSSAAVKEYLDTF